MELVSASLFFVCFGGWGGDPQTDCLVSLCTKFQVRYLPSRDTDMFRTACFADVNLGDPSPSLLEPPVLKDFMVQGSLNQVTLSYLSWWFGLMVLVEGK